MPDRESSPHLTPIPPPPPADGSNDVAAALAARRRRGRNLALFLTLLAWALVMYVAVMVKIHNDIRPG